MKGKRMNINTLAHLCNFNNGSKTMCPQQRNQYIETLNSICQKYNVGFSFSTNNFAEYLSISNNKKIWNIVETGRAKVKRWLFAFFQI